ncbi:MAG: uroporphyrinogen-III synthase [Chitinophagaceae bacterium]|nr:uroporphyrinogen-III synthase [Chitinophagaceae bacterium]
MNRFRLLVTRKISPSLVLRAGLNGIDVLEKEFIAIEPVTSGELARKIEKIISTKAVVVFTSRNAVKATGANYDVKDVDWKIYCLESATAKEVMKYFGEGKIAGTAANAEGLSKVIIQNADSRKIVFFCGNLRRDLLPATLRSNGFEVNEIVVYSTVLHPQTIVDDYDAVAFFSPSAVESFFSANKTGEGVVFFSVGKTTRDAIRKYTANKIFTSKKPSEESLFELANEVKSNF